MVARKKNSEAGFTLIEIVIAVAIVGIFAAVISPMVFRHLEDAKLSKAASETETVANAMLTYYKDVGQWPFTNNNGKTGSIDRLVSSDNVPTGKGKGANAGAQKWGKFGKSMYIGDYLFDNSVDNGNGAGSWRGPYTEKRNFNDPWGNAYVVNVRYLPGGKYTGDKVHKVMVLSAGPDAKWQTTFADGSTEAIAGDDIGYTLAVQ